jgi:hypothetical protein
MGPPGPAGLFAQRGHVPLDYKRGVPVARPRNRLRSGEEEDRKKGRKLEKLLASAAPECECVSATDTLPTTHSPPHPKCYGTVGCGVWAHLARLDSLPSAGTSLLDYKIDEVGKQMGENVIFIL